MATQYTPVSTFQNESTIVRAVLVQLIQRVPVKMDWELCKENALHSAMCNPVNQDNYVATKTLIKEYMDDLKMAAAMDGKQFHEVARTTHSVHGEMTDHDRLIWIENAYLSAEDGLMLFAAHWKERHGHGEEGEAIDAAVDEIVTKLWGWLPDPIQERLAP